MAQPNTEKTLMAGPIPAAIIEKVLLQGDLSSLTPDERLHYYKNVCESLGLNPLTKPFDYIVLDRKLTLYAKKDCTEQLRKIHGVSITELKGPEKIEDVYVVTAMAKDRDGRTDAATGAVSSEYTDDAGATHKVKGVALANLLMKAETKAKRRVTLSICGLGMFDESELDTATPTEASTSPAASVVERNVREATSNAQVESVNRIVENKGSSDCNDYGPKVITGDNYKELIAHIGKAQGRILGRKVGDMEPPVIEWMYNKWRDSLTPSATDQDFRLKLAIELAYQALQASPREKRIAGDTNKVDEGAREPAIKDLRERIENMALTEEQACGYLHKFGLFGEGWTSFNDAPTGLLLHLCTPQGWKVFKELLEKELKPRVTEEPKKGRKRAKRH